MRILFIRGRYHSNQHYAVKSLVDQGHDVRYLVWNVGPSENYTVLQPRQIPPSRVYLLLQRLVRAATKEEMQVERGAGGRPWRSPAHKRYASAGRSYGFPSFVLMYREIRRFDPDVVILKPGWYPMFIGSASLAVRMQGTPRVYCHERQLMSLMHKLSLKSQLRHPVRSSRLRRLRRNVSFTTLAGVFSPEKPVKRRKTYVIPLVVESAGDRPRAAAAGPVRILGVGQYFLPQKNHPLLVAAVAKVAASHDVALTLVGSGNPNDGHVAQLRRLACELGIEDKVSLVFNVPNAEMPDVYARHDLFVLPSSKEPCSYTILEAMAAGLPVIASDSCRSREYFDEGINGRVFASDDLDSLAAAIESIVRDRGVMRAMGEASMRIAKERYAPDVYHDRLMGLLWNEFGLGEGPRGNTIDTVNVAPALKEPTRVFMDVIGARPVAVTQAKPTGLVALTFDDGPTPQLTPFVLDVLKAKGVKATFFLVGSNAERCPDLVRRIRDEGHIIGNHSYSHPHFRHLSRRRAADEITRTNRILEQITGTKPVLFRYPHGQASDAGDAVIGRENMVGGVLWHRHGSAHRDYKCPGAAGVEKDVLMESVDQALILLHDGPLMLACSRKQWDYLPRAIDAVREKGLDFGVVAPASKASPLNQGSWVKVVRP